jgi:DNA-binding MarR family transcriptional regulator
MEDDTQREPAAPAACAVQDAPDLAGPALREAPELAAPALRDGAEPAVPASQDDSESSVSASHDDPELAAHLRLVIMRLARQLRSQTVAGLSPSLISALVTIERKGPVTLGQLAALERVKPPSVTRMVSALEQAALVRRVADPLDRRVARLSLTAEGKRTVERSRTRKTAFLARRLHELDDAQLESLRQALPVLEQVLEGSA